MDETWAGTVALAGAPNAGKSTLFNALLGGELSIVAARPQTTWRRVSGIHSSKTHQVILTDTPGMFAARDLFHRGMVEAADHAIADADVVLVVLDAVALRERARWDVPRAVLGRATGSCMAALNKTDGMATKTVTALVEQAGRVLATKVYAVSALDGTGVDTLRRALRAELPRSPFLYPPDFIAVDPVRFFTAEFVRETVFELYHDEIPYSVMCTIERFHEDDDPVLIEGILHVERSSQKGILIGDGGRAIRELGSRSRIKIERFLDRRVYLDLRVKVLAGWRRKRGYLRRLGLALPGTRATRANR